MPEEVHALLVLWGNYRRREKDGPQGYPRESPFVKASLYGKLGIPQESNVRIDETMPNLVALIEGIVEKMPVDLQEVIVARYMGENSFDEMARSLAMSTSTFRSRLESAQWYVYARMYP